MDKRHQVFVSSTYKDLKEERQKIIQALLQMGCFPSGMELFPAANEDQWTLIKKIIDDCDYYLVVIAGRYGSMDSDGCSYTEKEYRYAIERGKPVMAFLRESPEELPSNRTDSDVESQRKLSDFRKFVQERTCKYWKTAEQLSVAVTLSLVQMTKNHPSIGWVRGDQVVNVEGLNKIIERGVEELAFKDHYSAHSALETEIYNYLEKCKNENITNPKISINVMAISMVSSWRFLRDKIPDLLENNQGLSIDLKLLWVNPDMLRSIAMSKYSEIDWLKISQKRLKDTQDFLSKNPVCKERLKLQARIYKNLPHWHGILFNEKHLYLGRANWSFPEDERPRLSCARNKYRYFHINSDMGKERIDLFNNWYSFYTKFLSDLVYDSSI